MRTPNYYNLICQPCISAPTYKVRFPNQEIGEVKLCDLCLQYCIDNDMITKYYIKKGKASTSSGAPK